MRGSSLRSKPKVCERLHKGTAPTAMPALARALELLGFERATRDVQRARLLHAIVEFAQNVNDAELAKAAHALLPAADPTNPPVDWRQGFEEGFRAYADEDAGTDPHSAAAQAQMVWQMSEDVWRQARVAGSSEQGYDDGRDEAQTQNSIR